jgi:hypothetical protein
MIKATRKKGEGRKANKWWSSLGLAACLLVAWIQYKVIMKEGIVEAEGRRQSLGLV